MSTREFQNRTITNLRLKLPSGCQIENEWVAFKGFRNHYSPRVDIAVGPFSITHGENRIQEYNDFLLDESVDSFLRQAFSFHVQNIGEEYLNEIIIPDFNRLTRTNSNARCFLAIEIENSNSKKHLLGSIVNAASLGRVGIGVAYNDRALRTFVRIMNYLGFLKRVEKNTYDTTNFLILTKDQMDFLLNVNGIVANE